MRHKTVCTTLCRRLSITLLFLVLPLFFIIAIHYGLARADVRPSQTDALHPALSAASHIASILNETEATTDVVRGIVTELPLGGLGPWLIHISGEPTRTVVVLDLSVLLDGLLPAYSWVYIETEINLLGIEIATSIRLDDYKPGQVVARLFDGVSPEAIAGAYGLTISSTVLSSSNIYLFTTPQQDDDVETLAAQMDADVDIDWAEPNFIGNVLTGDPYKTWGWGGPDPGDFSNQNAFAQVNLQPALEHFRGDEIIVAVLDTGLDLNHPALASRWLTGTDLVSDDDVPQDEGPGLGWGHGTHIAGIIAHIAPQSRLLPVRVLDVDARGDLFTLAEAIYWAVEQGADVINLSLGAAHDAYVLRHALDYAAAQGVIVVAAAGNDNANTAQYPVEYETVIGVTAVTSDNLKADFANYGDWVELAAPGVDITSTIIGPQGSGYANWRGTSMSTAFVSGAAALARQRFPDDSPADILNLFTTHAENLDAQNPDKVGQLGGLLNISESVLDELTPTPAPTMTTTPTTTATPTATPTASITPTATLMPTQTLTVTATPVPSSTETPTPTPTPSPTQPAPGGVRHEIYLPLTMN